MNESERISKLIESYRAELLENPPIRGLQEGVEGRHGMAWGIAREDVMRVVRALKRVGMSIVEDEYR